MDEAPTMSTNYGIPQPQCERREEGQTGGDSRRGGTGEGEEKGACGWSARERIHKLNTHARMEEEREGEKDGAEGGSRSRRTGHPGTREGRGNSRAEQAGQTTTKQGERQNKGPGNKEGSRKRRKRDQKRSEELKGGRRLGTEMPPMEKPPMRDAAQYGKEIGACSGSGSSRKRPRRE